MTGRHSNLEPTLSPPVYRPADPVFASELSGDVGPALQAFHDLMTHRLNEKVMELHDLRTQNEVMERKLVNIHNLFSAGKEAASSIISGDVAAAAVSGVAETVGVAGAASDPPGAVASEAAMVEEPRTLLSLPAELLTLVVESFVIPDAYTWPRRAVLSSPVLLAQSLAPFAAASTVCLAAAQGKLRAALITAMQGMELEEVVAALRVHVAVALVAEEACQQIAYGCDYSGYDDDRDWKQAVTATVEAGAIEAVMEALQAHPQVAGVQQWGCAALARMCDGDPLDARETAPPSPNKQRVVEAGAIEAVVEALQTHLQVAGVQMEGCAALEGICGRWGSNASARARRQRAVEKGAIETVVATMWAHPQDREVLWRVCATLRDIWGGQLTEAPARKQRAIEAGALEAVAAAMQIFPRLRAWRSVVGVQESYIAAASALQLVLWTCGDHPYGEWSVMSGQ